MQSQASVPAPLSGVDRSGGPIIQKNSTKGLLNALNSSNYAPEALRLSHVCLGFLQRCLGRGSTGCRDLQGCSHGTEETAHLRDVWHNLTVVHAGLQLLQPRVIFSDAVINRNQGRNTDRLAAI